MTGVQTCALPICCFCEFRHDDKMSLLFQQSKGVKNNNNSNNNNNINNTNNNNNNTIVVQLKTMRAYPSLIL